MNLFSSDRIFEMMMRTNWSLEFSTATLATIFEISAQFTSFTYVNKACYERVVWCSESQETTRV